jgi:excisionase family DNA binding protein
MNKHSPTGKRRRARSGELFDTPDDFAKKAGISRATVWRLMRDGRLRFARFGRTRRIPRSEYQRLTSVVA